MSNVNFPLFRKSPCNQSLTHYSINWQHIKKTKLMTVQNCSWIMLKKLLKFHLLIFWKKPVRFLRKLVIKELKRSSYKRSILSLQLKVCKIFSRTCLTRNKFLDKKSRRFSIRLTIDSEAYYQNNLNDEFRVSFIIHFIFNSS